MGVEEIMTAVTSVGTAIAVTNLIKSRVNLGNWAALVSVLVAVLLTVAVYAYLGQDLFVGTMQGLLTGLTACGLYDLTPSDKVPVAQIETIDAAVVDNSDAETEIPVDEWGYSEDDVVEVVESDGDEEAIVD